MKEDFEKRFDSDFAAFAVIMAIVMCVMLIALSGCGQAAPIGPTDDHGWGWSYTQISDADGTRWRDDPALIILTPEQFQQQIVVPYLETEACVGTLREGPLVVPATKDRVAGYISPAVGGGMTYFDTGLIVLTTEAVLDDKFATGDPETGRLPGTSVTRHEFVHYLLVGTISDEDNRNHRSPLFKKCAGL